MAYIIYEPRRLLQYLGFMLSIKAQRHYMPSIDSLSIHSSEIEWRYLILYARIQQWRICMWLILLTSEAELFWLIYVCCPGLWQM